MMVINDVNFTLSEILHKLDSVTYNHSVRVLMICSEIADYLCLSDSYKLLYAALFHDIGKLYTPFNILDKSGSLSELERELVDLHPYIGYNMLSELGVEEDICRLVLYHHSFTPPVIHDIAPCDMEPIYDMALMLHTVDVFEALTSDRAYHRGISSKEAVNALQAKKDSYHPGVISFLSTIAFNEHFIPSAAHRNFAIFEPSIINEMIFDMHL